MDTYRGTHSIENPYANHDAIVEVLSAVPDEDDLNLYQYENDYAHLVSEDDLIEGLGWFVGSLRLQGYITDISRLNLPLLRQRVQSVCVVGDTAERIMSEGQILLSMWRCAPETMEKFGIVVSKDNRYHGDA